MNMYDHRTAEVLQNEEVALIVETAEIQEYLERHRFPADQLDDFIETLRAIRMRIHAIYGSLERIALLREKRRGTEERMDTLWAPIIGCSLWNGKILAPAFSWWHDRKIGLWF